MKKNPYIKPAMQVVMLKQKHSLLTASEEIVEPEAIGSDDPDNPDDSN